MKVNGNMRGVVVDNKDPLGKSRVRVRVFGMFDDLAVDTIPWAEYADPLMGGGLDSGGSFIPDEGDKVWVFFEAGDHRQPVYFAGAPSMLDLPEIIGIGYPKNRTFKTKAGHIINISDEEGNEHIRVFHRTGTHTLYRPDGSIEEYVVRDVERVIEGDLIETIRGNVFLNIHGNRQTIVHQDDDLQVVGDSSTYVGGNTVHTTEGDSLNEVVKNRNQWTGGNSGERINGNHTTTVLGKKSQFVQQSNTETNQSDKSVSIIGNKTTNIMGDLDAVIGGNSTTYVTLEHGTTSGGMNKVHSATHVDISGTMISFNAVGVSVLVTPSGDLVPTEEYAVTQANASRVMLQAGSSAPYDEPGDTIPEGWPDPAADPKLKDPVSNPTEITGDNNTSPISIGCEEVNDVDYNYRLSQNYTVRDLTLKPLFKHPLVAQNGLSLSDIVCNMKGLATNILEPLAKQFPDIHINSGFRVGSGNSQHNKGMAVDIQTQGWTPRKYSEVAKWIVDNLAFDQLIFEHGNSVWLHISYDRTKQTQRKQKLTYYPKNSPQYTSGLTNYYDNRRTI